MSQPGKTRSVPHAHTQHAGEREHDITEIHQCRDHAAEERAHLTSVLKAAAMVGRLTEVKGVVY